MATVRRGPTVEAKDKLVEVVVQVLGAYGALVSPKEPALQQRSDPVNSRHHYVGRVAAGRDVFGVVGVARFGKPGAGLSLPPVGLYDCPWLHRSLHERHEVPLRTISDAMHAHPSEPLWRVHLDGDRHDRFLMCFSALDALLRAANVGFIDLDTACKTIAPRSHHCGTKFVKPQPCRLVTAQPQDSLESESAGARFLARDPPHRLEPNLQRFVGLFEQCSSDDRGLVAATRAKHRQSGSPPRSASATRRAHKALRPSKRHEVSCARLLGIEASIEVDHIVRVVPDDLDSSRFSHSRRIPHWWG